MQITRQLSVLPSTAELKTRAVLKKLPAAHRALAELKGLVAAIPNESICTPPQDPPIILDLMGNLEQYFNDDKL